MTKHLSNAVGEEILDEIRRRTPGVVAKMMGDEVLPFSADLEVVCIVPFLSVTLQAVASCVLVVPAH